MGCQFEWDQDTVMDTIKTYDFGNGSGHGDWYFSYQPEGQMLKGPEL